MSSEGKIRKMEHCIYCILLMPNLQFENHVPIVTAIGRKSKIDVRMTCRARHQKICKAKGTQSAEQVMTSNSPTSWFENLINQSH